MICNCVYSRLNTCESILHLTLTLLGFFELSDRHDIGVNKQAIVHIATGVVSISFFLFSLSDG